MKIEIQGKPEFWFALTDEQMAVLELLSSVHYDLKCKMATMVNGFIYGWKNARSAVDKTSRRASFREIDTCLKILESLMMPPPAMSEAQQVVGHKLVKSFREALARADREGESWSLEIDV